MQTSTNQQELIKQAQKARNYSQSKYSGFRVGAALTSDDGKVFTGCNIESSSYGLTICAERVALFKALSEGKTKFKSIAIAGPHDEYCPPCGACRQVLFDYAAEIMIVMTNGSKIITKSLHELLPFAFEDSKLKKR